MTRAPKNVTRAALVLALASTSGGLVAAPAFAAVGDLTGGSTPLPVPTVTTSPLPLPVALPTDTTSPTASPSPSPSPSPSTTSTTTSPAPTTDPTPAPSSDPAPPATTTTSTTSTTSTAGAQPASSGSVSSGATVASGSAGSTTGASSSLSASQPTALVDLTKSTARRATSTLLAVAGDPALRAPDLAAGFEPSAGVQPMQAAWSDTLSELAPPALPGAGGGYLLAPPSLPGIAPLVAGAPQQQAGAHPVTRPVLTASRSVPSSGGDPVGLTLFACAAAAVAAGLARWRTRGY